MPGLALIVFAAFALGLAGLLAFLWTLTDGQYDDLDGAAERILIPDENEQKQV